MSTAFKALMCKIILNWRNLQNHASNLYPVTFTYSRRKLHQVHFSCNIAQPWWRMQYSKETTATPADDEMLNISAPLRRDQLRLDVLVTPLKCQCVRTNKRTDRSYSKSVDSYLIVCRCSYARHNLHRFGVM